jgi:hypothetical protein
MKLRLCGRSPLGGRSSRMSAIGTKRTYRVALHMSAFGGKADIAEMSTVVNPNRLRFSANLKPKANGQTRRGGESERNPTDASGPAEAIENLTKYSGANQPAKEIAG